MGGWTGQMSPNLISVFTIPDPNQFNPCHCSTTATRDFSNFWNDQHQQVCNYNFIYISRYFLRFILPKLKENLDFSWVFDLLPCCTTGTICCHRAITVWSGPVSQQSRDTGEISWLPSGPSPPSSSSSSPSWGPPCSSSLGRGLEVTAAVTEWRSCARTGSSMNISGRNPQTTAPRCQNVTPPGKTQSPLSW